MIRLKKRKQITIRNPTNYENKNSTQKSYKICGTCERLKRNMKKKRLYLDIIHNYCCHKDHLPEIDVPRLQYE